MVPARDAEALEELRDEARDGRLAGAGVAGEHHVPDRIEHVLALLPPLNVEGELLTDGAHLLLDPLHARQLLELLLPNPRPRCYPPPPRPRRLSSHWDSFARLRPF